MPTDLSPHPRKGVIQVRDRAGIGLPFSKGLMATSILATGVETDVAYNLAAGIERELRSQRHGEIAADELAKLAKDMIARELGPDVAERYHGWRRAKRTGHPVFIVMSGAPGVGKSTIATRLAIRLGITRIVTTDTIREVLRTVIPETVLPELHVSTYESTAAEGHGAAPPLASFQRQAGAVGAATAAVARRLAAERRSAILEGVHLLPGHLCEHLASHPAHPLVVEILLKLDDEDLHAAHLTCRLDDEPARGGLRHMKHFREIRSIQEWLCEMAHKAGTATFDIADPEHLTQCVVDQVVEQAGAAERTQQVGAA
jgi:2-phosphoglycerate kinase